MALIKVPDGGFYVDNSQVTVDYAKKSISIVGGGAAGDYLSLDGGMMNAGATITGEDELTIEVPDTGESASVGVTHQGVTLVHNTNSVADSSVRVIATGIELKANTTTVSVNGTGINFGGVALFNIASIGASESAIAFENEMDMNNHKIINVTDPTAAQDVVTKNYADTNYATKTEIADFITVSDIPNATSSVKGLVNQGVAVSDVSGTDAASAITTINALLVSLRNAGIIANS